MSQNKQGNLFKALGLFIDAMRLFLSLELEKRFGKNWEEIYNGALSERQKIDWNNQTQNGQIPSKLIDFGNLGPFAVKQKDFFRPFFDRSVNKLPTMFFDIAEARNMTAHYDNWDDDLAESAYLNMIRISKALDMFELVSTLRKLRKTEQEVIQSKLEYIPRRNDHKREHNGVANSVVLSKRDAINIVNNYLGSKSLTSRNTNYSNINSAIPVWWLNINPERFKNILNILLVKSDGGLIWLKIPEGQFLSPEQFFYIREDKNLVDLRISSEQGLDYLRDLYSVGVDFKPFIQKEFSNIN